MSYILLTWLLAPLWWPISLFRKLLNPQPKRILILEIAGIGDVVCSANLLAQLRVQRSQTQIDLVLDPIAATLAPALTMVDHVIQFPYASQRGLIGRLRLIKYFLAYDTVICLIPSAAQLTAMCLAATPRRLSILPQPINWSYKLLRPMLTLGIEHLPGTYFPGTQAVLLESLGLSSLSVRKHLVPQKTSMTDSSVKTVGVLVGSGRALKRVDVAHWITIISGLLARQPHLRVALLGGLGDKSISQQILAQMPLEDQGRIADLAGRYTLSDLPNVLVTLGLLIGVDSGVTHMADALGVPLICLAGPVDLNEVYEPGAGRVLLTSELNCHPCSRVFDTPAQCYLGHRRCLQDLNPMQVVDKVMQLLETRRGT